MRATITALLLTLLVTAPAPATAGELAGVTMPDTVSVDGHGLSLVGMGLRKKLVFQVYVGGLYMAEPSTDAAEVIESEQVKRVTMSMLRSLDGSKIGAAVREGFENNCSAEEYARLSERLETLVGWFPAVGAGDTIELTYQPGTGTSVTAQGKAMGVVPGADFARALFAVWFGSVPADAELKRGMLGG